MAAEQNFSTAICNLGLCAVMQPFYDIRTWIEKTGTRLPTSVMSQPSTSRPNNPATDPSRVEGISCAQIPPADEDPPSAAVEVGRKIDNLHQKLREVTGFLGNVQKSLDTVLSVLEEVEHNVKALSSQRTPLVRLPVMPELSTTLQVAGKSLRDEDESLEAGPNEERKKKRRTDIPQLRDVTTDGAADKTDEQEPAEEMICSGTDC